MTITTQVVVVGNLVRDVELRYTQAGKPVASFTVAATPRSYDRAKSEWRDGEPVFTRCTAWDEQAENIAASFVKGTRVIVAGTFKASKYKDKDGNDRTGTDLIVDEIGPSLKYATAVPEKRGKKAPPPQGSQQGGAAEESWAPYDENDTPF